MATKEFTELPTVTAAALTDIICAVQGGVSVQETLSQITDLARNNIVLSFAGNPNGNVAGRTFQLLWDTVGQALFICTVTGSTTTSVWTMVTSTSPAFTWNVITGTNAVMSGNNGYIPNNAGLVTLVLPTVSPVGEIIRVTGLGIGGWMIAQNALQSIVMSASTTTVGPTGSISSTVPGDAVELVTTIANTQWTFISGASGNITVV